MKEEIQANGYDQIINFKDLPKEWQDHVRQRQADGYMPKDKMEFTKFEILSATANKESFTPSAVVDKLFERVDKEKIAFNYLPQEWQKALESINKFDNITVDYLKKKGATDENIEMIKKGAYLRDNDTRKLAKVRSELTPNDIKDLDEEPAKRLIAGRGLDKENVPMAASSMNVGGLWNSVKSGWSRLFGRK